MLLRGTEYLHRVVGLHELCVVIDKNNGDNLLFSSYSMQWLWDCNGKSAHIGRVSLVMLLVY